MPIKRRHIPALDYECDECGCSYTHVLDYDAVDFTVDVEWEEESLRRRGWIVEKWTTRGHFWKTGIDGKKYSKVVCPQCNHRKNNEE